MKLKLLKTIVLLLIAIFCNGNQTFGQSTSTGSATGFPNFPSSFVPPDYLGWDGNTLIDLYIEHRGIANIDFLLGNTQQMTLKGAGYAFPGFMGLGANFLSPTSLLHLNAFNNLTGNLFRTDGNQSIVNLWQLSTGTSATTQNERLGIFTSNGWNGLAPNNMSLDANWRSSTGNTIFWTNSSTGSGISKRMIINSDSPPNLSINGVTAITDPGWNTNGYVGIGLNVPDFSAGSWVPIWDVDQGGTGPRSLLHLQGPNNSVNNSGMGWRTWMRTGMYVNENSDEMYIGMKNEFALNGARRSDAVIMWGDAENPMEETFPDNFRIIFGGIGPGGLPGNATSSNGYNSHAYNGMEMLRIVPNGKVGIGQLFTFSLPPARRLELLDWIGTGGNSFNEPQLRLTFQQAQVASPNTTGVWTDFQTTNLGDLNINPFGITAVGNNTPINRNVGICTSVPSNRLEIDAVPGTLTNINRYTGPGGGLSGLTFNDLASNSAAATAGTYTKFLTVDANGIVILGEVPGTGGAVSACGTINPSTDLNYITKWTTLAGGTREICSTKGIYEQSTGSFNVGIGVGSSPNNKLHVGGNINVNSSADVYKIGNQTVLRIGNLSTFVGVDAGGTTGGDRSTLVGYHAGYNSGTSSTDNTFMGDRAGLNNTTGSLNTFIGQSAGKGNVAGITGTSNICLGNLTGISLQNASNNLIAGVYSGYYNASGNDNVLLGYFAGYPTVSANNTFVGSSAGSAHTTGAGNTFIGKSTNDVAYSAGSSEYSTLLGYNARAESGTTTGLSNATALGANSKVECDNCMVLGSSGGSTQVKVGIGYTNPTTATGTPGSEQFLLYVKDIPASTTPPCTTGCVSTNSAFFKGNIYAANTWYPSDSTLKLNVQTMPATSSISLLSNLTPKTYTFDQASNPQLALPAGLQYGLIAEEVERVLPNLVKSITAPAILDTAGKVISPDLTFKALNYTGLIPLLLAATQEQQLSIDSLKKELTEIKKLIADCCTKTSSGGTGAARLSVMLENTSAIILDQNTPNPFAEQTTITFTIPDEIQKAQIIFYEKSGRVMKVTEVQERGNGSLTVYAEKLSSGIYSYSLIADGKLIDTKKMVCTK